MTDDDEPSHAPDERDVIKCAFSTAHPFTPKGWQVDVGSKLLSASCDTSRAGPIPILLVRPTGGGKSAVRDAVGLSLGGVILTICPLLSLAADQVDKLKPLANREANVDGFNFDAIQNSREAASAPAASAPAASAPAASLLPRTQHNATFSSGFHTSLINNHQQRRRRQQQASLASVARTQ